jgi:hypothetical protein
VTVASVQGAVVFDKPPVTLLDMSKELNAAKV